MRRTRGSRTALFTIFAAVGLLALAQLSTASAAQLELDAPTLPSALEAERCAEQVQSSTPAAPSTTSVRVEEIPAECAGLPVTVRVYTNSAATPSAPVAVPNGGGAVTLTVPQFSPTASHKAYVTIGDWPVPATWNYSPWSCTVVNGSNQPVANRNCTVTGLSATLGTYGGLTGLVRDNIATFTFATTHNASTGQYVRIEADLSTAAGLTPGWFSSAPNPATYGTSSLVASMACGELPWFTARSANPAPGTTFTQPVRSNRSSPAWWFSGGPVSCG